MVKELDERTKSLKIVFAMIRSPRMCDLLYKAERKKFSTEKIKAMQESAVLTLRQYKFDEKSADQFVENIFTKLDKQVNTDVATFRDEVPQ